MQSEYIRVSEVPEHRWMVFREPHGESLMSFEIKSHAVAFARAVSFSGKLTLFIDDGSGVAVRQLPASLTYPTILN
jgi:hypothetical protein